MSRRHLVLAVLAVLALAATWVGGVRHDYIYYVEQWQLVLAKADPWSTNNAYGPLHNLFALLLPLHPLAPKLAQTLLLLIAGAGLVRRLPTDILATTNLALALLANGLIWVSVFWYGNNDGLVAALVLLAVLDRLDGRMVMAGVWLGLATLDKFYPALLIPFFALSDRQIAPRVVLSAFLTIAAGLAIGTLIWGQAMLEALLFGVSRDATILSILRGLTVVTDGHPAAAIVNLLIRLNALMVIGVWGLALVVAWIRREHWLVASCWGLAAVLITYKVGHPQFWVTWLALLAALPLASSHGADARRLMKASWPFVVLLSAFQLGYELLPPGYYRGPYQTFRDTIGFVAFAMIAVQLWLYFRPAPRPRT